VSTHLNGIGGNVTGQVSGGSLITFGVTKWTGKISVDKLDRTNSASGGYKESIPGNAVFSGSFEAYADNDQLPDIAGTNVFRPHRHLSGGTSDTTKYYVAMTLTLGNSGKKYTLSTASIFDLEVTSETANGVTFTGNFESSGAFTGPA
jgi:hypothetical protein